MIKFGLSFEMHFEEKEFLGNFNNRGKQSFFLQKVGLSHARSKSNLNTGRLVIQTVSDYGLKVPRFGCANWHFSKLGSIREAIETKLGKVGTSSKLGGTHTKTFSLQTTNMLCII